MLKFSKIISSKSKNIVKEKSWYLRIFHFVEMNVSKLINYSTNMCWNGQGSTVLFTHHMLQLKLVSPFKLMVSPSYDGATNTILNVHHSSQLVGHYPT